MFCLDIGRRTTYCPISTWYDSHGGLAYDHIQSGTGPRKPTARNAGLAGQETPAVADGADRPDRLVRDAAHRLGHEPTRLARRLAGTVVDRTNPALHPAAHPRPAIWAGRAEPAR